MTKYQMKEPLTEKCFQCHKIVLVKYCPPLQAYVKKNNWGYWTEKEENKDKYICDNCLRNFYYDSYEKFCEEVQNQKRKNVLRTYLTLKVI